MGAFRQELIEGIARLELDLPGQPVNKISRAVKEELESILPCLQADERVRAVVLISGKPDNFIAGADIDEFTALTTRDEALALVKAGQGLINQVANLGKPIVAAIHGACVGGGFETALACSYRIATDHPKTVLGLPEVQLGIIPAAGGCQRLPRLVGLRVALDMILAGKTIPAKAAFKRGMVDELVHPAILEEVAFKAARSLPDGRKRKRRGTGGVAALLLDRNVLGRKLVFSKARKSVLQKTGGHYPAPLAALEAVSHGLAYGIEAGMDSEAAHFAELAIGGVSKRLVEIFFASTALKKDPGVEGAAPQAKRVQGMAVVGAGFMGSAIAGVAVAKAKVDVRLRDTKLEDVARGVAAARMGLERRLKRRRITKYDYRRLRSLISGGVDWAGFARSDLVIEAVYEDLDVKREVFTVLEQQVSERCLLASNTSTIPIKRIAEAVQCPERVLGMHFFSPVEKMPLLEVIVTDETAPWATVTAVAFGRRMGKTVIVVRDTPGFWVNRILAPYMNEAGRMLEEGVPVETLDKSMTTFGFPVGPVTLLDEVGLDVALKASAVLYEAYGDRIKPIESLGRMTEEGRLGRKSGRGFYIYQDGKKKGVDRAVYDIVSSNKTGDVSDRDVRRRLVFVMLNEAARALEEGVVRSPRDGDIGAVFGIGFPPFRGGPLRYMDELGSASVVDTLNDLARRYGDRFTPAPMLERLTQSGASIYAHP
ncbi:MAG: fatty acid oxidation complex subunit alpha FadJ [Gemmatimonadales bacterium]